MNIINPYRFGITPVTNPDAFIMEFNMGAGETLTIPLFNTTGYNFVITWGDGNTSPAITTYNDGNLAHTYTNAGTYQVELLGTVKGIYFNNGGSKLKLTKIIQWGNCGFTTFYSAFNGCTNLNSLPTGSITGATSVAINGFRDTFLSCAGLTVIPTDLFRYTTLVSTLGFNRTFYGCTNLTTIPTDLFRYNTLVSSNGFNSTFFNCINLTTVPNYLFKYNTAVSTQGFYRTFQYCRKLQISPWLFYADGEQSTRFLNKSCNFQECFDRSSFTGTQGTAPDLWNCDFGTGSVTKTDCFNGAGNSTTSLTNYNDIPAEWL